MPAPNLAPPRPALRQLSNSRDACRKIAHGHLECPSRPGRSSGKERKERPAVTSFKATFIPCLFLAALIHPAGGVSAADPEWKVGLAQLKITPDQPVLMAGYASRKKPFEKVATDLFVKALVLEDGEGRRGVIVTSDLIGFPAAVAEPICE